jgi:hypothetical protein
MPDTMTIRVLDAARRIVVASYGHEWYAGHVLGVIERLGLGLVVQERQDDGSWEDVTESAVPY